MAKKNEIDKVIKDLYDKTVDFNDKLAVLKEWNKLEIARLKGSDGPGDDVPEGLKD